MKSIEYNIALPNGSSGVFKKGAPTKYPFGDMNVGDSFSFENDKAASVYTCAYSFCTRRRLKWKFSVRKDAGGNYRCWRVE